MDHIQYDESNPKRYHAEALGLTERTKTQDTAAIRHRWRQMVREYSGLALTRPSDRLPAIQGCMEQIREHLKESNNFGLWEGELVQDLAWSMNDFNPGPRPTVQSLTPTWSWASVGARVYYCWVNEDLAHAQFAKTPVHDTLSSSHASSLLLLTGQLISGRLKLAESTTPDHPLAWDNGIAIDVDHEYLDPRSKS